MCVCVSYVVGSVTAAPSPLRALGGGGGSVPPIPPLGGGLSRRDFVHAASGSIFSYINNPDGTGYSVNTRVDYFCRKINSLFTLVLAARFCLENENDGDCYGSNNCSRSFSLERFGCTKHGKSEKACFLKTYVFRSLGMFGVRVFSVPLGGVQTGFRGWVGGCELP